MTQLSRAREKKKQPLHRQWGVSLTVRKTDKHGEGRKEGRVGRFSPPPSSGLALSPVLQSEPVEIGDFSGEEGKPMQAEVPQANVTHCKRQKAFY